MEIRWSYLHNGSSYTGKMTSLYWIIYCLTIVKPWPETVLMTHHGCPYITAMESKEHAVNSRMSYGVGILWIFWKEKISGVVIRYDCVVVSQMLWRCHDHDASLVIAASTRVVTTSTTSSGVSDENVAIMTTLGLCTGDTAVLQGSFWHVPSQWDDVTLQCRLSCDGRVHKKIPVLH